MKRNVLIIGATIVLALIAGGGFYGGMVYGESQIVVPGMTLGPQGAGVPGELVLPGNGQGRAMGGGAPGGMTVGEIVSIDENGLVIADLEGKEIQVSVTDTTLIEKQAPVTLAELTAGETVSVSGNEEDGGSITARSLQVVSAARFGLATQ
jgi:hypothetical protein